MASIKDSVYSIPREQFLATSTDTLVEHLLSSLTIDPLVLQEDQMQMDHSEAQVEVTGRFEYDMGTGGRIHAAGHRLTFYIPFAGDPGLWKLRPNMWISVMPQGDVDPRRSVLTITLTNTANTEPERYQRELESTLQGIRQLISSQAQLLSQYHAGLGGRIREVIERRRKEVEKLQGLTAAFNIPMVKKAGMPEFKPVEMAKRISRPLPRPPAAGFKPEPAITTETYEELLAIIRHAGASFEGAPQTYQPLGEEGLRDNVLSHINVVFEGKATGETFRKYGKTDIRIEEESRSAFVGECKLWGGEKVLLEALTQLLGYTTWRDCKAALIMFNKDVAGFSGVQSTIDSVLRTHPKFLRAVETGRVGEWRFVFQSQEDASREVTVHVFAFNLYVVPERAAKKR
ncbi:MAG: hypothetical protein U1F50_09535 [Rubrivivax sp.]